MGTRADYCYGRSVYYRAEDLAGKPAIQRKIAAVEDVEFDRGVKPVLSFENDDKRLPINATNFDILTDAFGGFTENWVGKTVRLRVEKVRFKGRSIDSIRVIAPPKTAQVDKDLNDDLPPWAA
jgi:hypothetical protein